MLVNIPEEIAAAYRQQARKTKVCVQELIFDVLEQNAPIKSSALIDVLSLDEADYASDLALLCISRAGAEKKLDGSAGLVNRRCTHSGLPL